MSTRLYRRRDVDAEFAASTWQTTVFSELAASLTNTNRPFPCLFGVAGFRQDSLRYGFVDALRGDQVAPLLSCYLAQARNFGPNTSLLLFVKPEGLRTLEHYRKQFWRFIADLSQQDSQPWPAGLPRQLDHPKWEFCFAGEPVFVVCNTPAHIFRQSRRSSTMMVAFQPRWVFDNITNTPENADRAFAAVRQRLEAYDMIPRSPDLGRYGDPNVREYKQYFLEDNNVSGRCPFATLHDTVPQTSDKLENA